jgi:hypothetical protein
MTQRMSTPAIPVVIIADESSGGSLSTTQYLKAYDLVENGYIITITPTIDVDVLATTGEFDAGIDFNEFINELTLDPTIDDSGGEDIVYAIYDFGNGYIRKSETPSAAIIYDYSLSPDGLYSINIYFYGGSGNYINYNLLLEKSNGYISKLTHNSATEFTYYSLNNVAYVPIDAGVIGNPIDEDGIEYTVIGTLDFHYEPQLTPDFSEPKQYTPTTECNTLANGIQYPLLTALDECTLGILDALINETTYEIFRTVLTGIDQFIMPADTQSISVYTVTVGDSNDRPTITDADSNVSVLYAGVEEKFEANGLFANAFTVDTNHANDVVIIRYIVKYVAP